MKRIFLTVLSISALLLSIPAGSEAFANPFQATSTSSILYVVPETNGTCRGSWGNACDLQTALNAAGSGDEIWAAEGVYYPGPTGNYTATFQLKSGVALYGGFGGTETEREQRDWGAQITVLSGDIDHNDVTDPHGVVTDTNKIMGYNSNHVVYSTGATETAVLDGFIITAGYAIYRGTSCPHNIADYGGGMYNENSNLILSNVIFFSNRAYFGGGGMYNSGSPILSNVNFSKNIALGPYGTSGCGGGMYNSGDPTLSNVTFSSNGSYDGGGMCNIYGSPTLSYVTM